MVLVDDNFASIVAAVREGRRVWANIRKILVFNMPVNLAQGTSVMYAFILSFSNAPLTALQVCVERERFFWSVAAVLAPPGPRIVCCLFSVCVCVRCVVWIVCSCRRRLSLPLSPPLTTCLERHRLAEYVCCVVTATDSVLLPWHLRRPHAVVDN